MNNIIIMIVNPLILLYINIHYMQHVQLNLNLTGGRMASETQQNMQSASEFLFKECPIGGFCAGEKIPIHEVCMYNIEWVLNA
jgi:hypothetical protein